ncbi:MAG: ABC-2 transporter permease [Oscillospiraceae bacterium]|nr:ABC-2 transporter permease [Oscillospiraceae bacterium]
MKGLFKKDLYLVGKNIRAAAWIPILIPIVVTAQNKTYFMPVLALVLSLLFACQVSRTMSMDESCNWWKNVTAFPVSGAQEAGSKYLFLLLMSLLAGVSVFAVGMLASLFHIADVRTAGLYSVLSFLNALLYGCVAIPVSYRFGTESSRYILMLFVLLPTLFPFAAYALGWKNHPDFLEKLSPPLVLFLAAVLLCLIAFVSFCISERVLRTHRRKVP